MVNSAVLTAAVIVVCSSGLISAVRVPVLMPAVQPTVDDTYLCHSIPVHGASKYITKYIPKAQAMIAHHMLMFGCGEPGSAETHWNCGEMMATDKDSTPAKPVCKGVQKTIYAWAMDAPGLEMPKGIAFKVGGDSGINHIIVQVHYKNTTAFKPPLSRRDSSGVLIDMQTQSTDRLAGIYVLGTGGVLAANARVNMDTACVYSAFATLHPFKYRVHTHKHGRVVSGYVVKAGEGGARGGATKEFLEIGHQSPQLPQMFYNVTDAALTVEYGDGLAARCVMQNDGAKAVPIGPTQNDEMCNFYVMYWIDAKDEQVLSNPEVQACFSAGPPYYAWEDDFARDDIPRRSTQEVVATAKHM